jgi:hypothetical protein
MPRRSSSDDDMTVVSLLPGKGRPEPPAGLDTAETRAWRDVIDSLPAQWLDPAGQAILRGVVAEIALCDRLAERLRQFADAPVDEETLAAEKQIAVMHRDALRAVSLGLGTLRATPQSRMLSREGRNRFERGASRSRPWEIVAGKAGKPDKSDPDGSAA